MRNIIRSFLFSLALAACMFTGAQAGDDVIEIVVAKDDSLISLSRELLEDPLQWPEIARMNKLEDPDHIHPGQRLMIPVVLLKGEPVKGTVTFAKGEVYVEPDKRRLSFGDTISEGSTIETGPQSAAEISYDDGTVLLLKQNTTVQIESTKRKSATHFFHRFFLQAGQAVTQIRTATGKVSDTRIRTPSAVSGARGTEFRVGLDTSAATRTETLHGLVDVEAMKTKVALTEGEGTLVRPGTPPLPPVKLLPPPAPVDLKPLYAVLPLSLSFTMVEDAHAYRATFATDAEGKDAVWEDVFAPSEPLHAAELPDGDYFLLSQSIDELGLEGKPSMPVLVHVRVNPLPPVVQSPAYGTRYRGELPVFEWAAVEDAKSYRVQIAADSEFTRIVQEKGDLTETSYAAGPLAFDRYQFRVSAVASDGHMGEWSNPLEFSIVPPPPSPTMKAPMIDKGVVYISWEDIGGGTTYHAQMARDRAFDQIIADTRVDATSMSLPRPREPGTYYVRVAGIDHKGFEGDFSPPVAFEITRSFPFGIAVSIGILLLLAL